MRGMPWHLREPREKNLNSPLFYFLNALKILLRNLLGLVKWTCVKAETDWEKRPRNSYLVTLAKQLALRTLEAPPLHHLVSPSSPAFVQPWGFQYPGALQYTCQGHDLRGDFCSSSSPVLLQSAVTPVHLPPMAAARHLCPFAGVFETKRMLL